MFGGMYLCSFFRGMVQALRRADHSTLSKSVVVNVPSLMLHISSPVAQLGRLLGVNVRNYIHSLRQACVLRCRTSFDTLLSYLDTTFTAFPTAFAHCQSSFLSSDSIAESLRPKSGVARPGAYLAVLVGPSLEYSQVERNTYC